jgi:hypothetical protein
MDDKPNIKDVLGYLEAANVELESVRVALEQEGIDDPEQLEQLKQNLREVLALVDRLAAEVARRRHS